MDKLVIKSTKMLIDNELCEGGGRPFSIMNPSTEEPLCCEVRAADAADVDRAVLAARQAFHPDSPWRTMDASQRGRLLMKLADLLERDSDHLDLLLATEGGKPSEERSDEIFESQATMRYYAGWADKIHGKVIPSDGEVFAYTRQEPIGVCALVLPYNFPLTLCTSQLSCALATGNVVVVKASEYATLGVLHLAALVKEAGFPKGVVNVLTGAGEIGHALSTHMDVDKIVFIGGLATASKVLNAAANSNHKRVTIEAGGKSPIVVFDDCEDVRQAAVEAHQGVFYYQGQVCAAATRTYVHEKIYDEFVRISVELAESLVVGDPLDSTTNFGPLINKAQFDKVISYIEKGVVEGAKLECGGERHGSKGYFVRPTVFSNVTDQMAIARDEIFGPIQCILKFSTLDEVIDRANDSPFGLCAGIYSQDVNKCTRFIQRIRAGKVNVNHYEFPGPQLPQPAWKQSGNGVDLGKETLKEYLNMKTVCSKIVNKCS